MGYDIKFVTVEDLLVSMPQRWYNHYYTQFNGWFDEDKKRTWQALCALNDDCKVLSRDVHISAINEIICNDTWTRLSCDFCHNRPDKIALLIDPEEHQFNICIPCCMSKLVDQEHEQLIAELDHLRAITQSCRLVAISEMSDADVRVKIQEFTESV